MKVGVVGYGSYVPYHRVEAELVAKENRHDWKKVGQSLGVIEKAVPARDEDAVTFAVQAARNALARAGIAATALGVVYVGSESHPYAVKPSASIVGAALGLNMYYAAADFEFACKAGTAALQAAFAQVKGQFAEYALALGTDTAQAAGGDILEYTAGAAAAAFIVGVGEGVIASLDATLSLSSDTPDFWRRGLQKFPAHVGRFTAEPGYFAHVQATTLAILEKSGMKPGDFAHVIFHQPNMRFPVSVAHKLGFTPAQLDAGLLVKQVGNSYSASSLLGLSATLDIAKAGQKILLVSYGSGSGCDAFVFTATERLMAVQSRATKTLAYVQRKNYIAYSQYRNNINLVC